jgi:hypothetical protein
VTLTWSEHPEAHDDLADAARWYDKRNVGLGDALLDCVEAVLEGVLEWPGAAPPFPGWGGQQSVRAAGIRRFPYRVDYVDGARVIVIAYAHDSRAPDYWVHRLSP